jgi:hypothetical protein
VKTTAAEAQALLATKKSELSTIVTPFLEAVEDAVELSIENLSNKCSVSVASIPAEWVKPAVKSVEDLGYTTILVPETLTLHVVF